MFVLFFGFDEFFVVSGFADELGHGAHGAVDAPGAGFEEDHGDETQKGGGEHHAVEAEGELGHPGREGGAVIRPVPGGFEHPEDGDGFFEIRAGEDQIGVPEHHKEHGEEEDQETVAEAFALQPTGHILFTGEAETAAQQSEELASVAVAVAESLTAADDGDEQRQEKGDQAEPGEHDIEKAQRKVDDGEDPQIIVPMFFHPSLTSSAMTVPGHSLTHLPHPTQRAGFGSS